MEVIRGFFASLAQTLLPWRHDETERLVPAPEVKHGQVRGYRGFDPDSGREVIPAPLETPRQAETRKFNALLPYHEFAVKYGKYPKSTRLLYHAYVYLSFHKQWTEVTLTDIFPSQALRDSPISGYLLTGFDPFVDSVTAGDKQQLQIVFACSTDSLISLQHVSELFSAVEEQVEDPMAAKSFSLAITHDGAIVSFYRLYKQFFRSKPLNHLGRLTEEDVKAAQGLQQEQLEEKKRLQKERLQERKNAHGKHGKKRKKMSSKQNKGPSRQKKKKLALKKARSKKKEKLVKLIQART